MEFVDGTPDMRHVILDTNQYFGPVCLSPGVYGGTYEWSEGGLAPIGVLPDGEVVGGGFAGVRGGLSSDGSRVVWVDGGGLYLRDMVSRETVLVAGTEAEPADFQIGDGEESPRVFYTASEGSLNVFEVTSGSGESLAGKSTELVGEGGVDGVIGTSEDGSYLYFVDGNVLGDGAEHGAESGGDNLYVEHYDAASKAWAPPVFIALLSGEDSASWSGRLEGMTSRVCRTAGI